MLLEVSIKFKGIEKLQNCLVAELVLLLMEKKGAGSVNNYYTMSITEALELLLNILKSVND